MTAHDDALRPDQSLDGSGGRRRWSWLLSGALLVAIVVAATAVFQYGLPWWMEEGDRNHTFTGPEGSQRYQVHVPPDWDSSTQLPVMMAIHGCGMTGFGWNSMKGTTQFNDLADREGFIVVYPTQRLFRNAINCWNSGDPREQHRGGSEPALLAGVAREVVDEYNADPDHVHVAGASSGAGTAVILAATYPDVFATATSVAGGEYGLNQVDPESPDTTPPTYTARQAWAQMGDRARQVPLLVIQGEEDEVVPPVVATRLVEHWTAVSDLVEDGLLDGDLRLAQTSARLPAEADRHAFTHTTLTLPDGSSLIESYLVHEMGHVWPGPSGVGLFTDRAGPDASAFAWDFARHHPKVPSP
ncbi:extracellular catalytic domain type 1 short-chain-length polyhydroxyalkanoate depolymerase [Demequina muriae]|uniref:PHB depolymerase family esterase n=1 Tax=Demequina muriae TaxID=3051664 RepID=A0ABT8GJL5_9MICO|nr:PHB depolymerase family esterase [Demequina sp. EGI L300058]MDN4481632.1 PHB depolymerase family esterase [Demequina sp. EGI L300058]